MRLPVQRPFFCQALIWIAVFASVSANAQNLYTWQGGGGNNEWTNNANWYNNAAPVSSLTQTLVFFRQSSSIYPSINIPYSVAGVYFDTNASAFVFDSGPLTVGASGFRQNAANPQAFGAAVLLGADQTWTLANGSGALTFGNSVNTTDGSGTARALTVDATTTAGSGNVINGVINGGGSLSKTGVGTLTLTGACAYTGGTAVSAGTLALISGSLGTSASSLTIDNTAANNPTFLLGGNADGTGATLQAQYEYVGNNATGTFTQNGGTNTVGVSLAICLFGTAGTYNLSGGILQLGAGGVSAYQGNSVLNLNGGTLRAGSKNLVDTDPITGGTLARINVQAGGARIDTNGYSPAFSQPLLHDNSSGAAAIDGGLTKLGAGTLTVTRANTYTGATSINGGTLSLNGSGTLGVGGNIAVAATGKLDVSALTGNLYTLASGRTLSNLGTITGNLTVASNAIYTGGGTVNGLLRVDSGGLVAVSGGTLTVNGGVINNGTVRLLRGASLVVGSGGTFTNNSGATLDIITGNISAPAGFYNNGAVIDSGAVKAKSVSLQGNNFTVTIDGYTGHTYQLQRSNSLVNANYGNLGSAKTGITGQVLSFADGASSGPQKFYRVQVDP